MPRRRPQQARSRARYDALLDAADAVFLEQGFAEATTREIAARAGSSVGALYRFFPDKEAMLVALAERYGERMAAVGAQVTAKELMSLSVAERVRLGVRGFAAFLQAHPGFLTLMQEAKHPALAEGRRAHQARMSGLIAGGLVDAGLSTAEIEAIAAVLECALSALQGLAVTAPPARREALLAETEHMVSAYLEARLPSAPERPTQSGQ